MTQERNTFLREDIIKDKSKLYEKSKCGSNCTTKKIICLCCLGCILIVCLGVGGFLLYLFTKPSPFDDPEKWNHLLNSARGLGDDVPLDGTYTLVSFDENYETYLRGLGIPWLVLPLVLSASETLELTFTERGGQVITITDWGRRSMEYEFGKEFNMTYGKKAGIMYTTCTRPEYEIIFCRSEERSKDWILTSEMKFSQRGMVNERVFLNKNITAKKFYEKRDFDLEDSKLDISSTITLDIFQNDTKNENWFDEDW